MDSTRSDAFLGLTQVERSAWTELAGNPDLHEAQLATHSSSSGPGDAKIRIVKLPR